MTRTILTVALAAIFGVGGTIASRIQTAPEEDASELALKNIEALGNEEMGYGCGYAAYEWDNSFWHDTKFFTKCKAGCPEGSGTEPKYIFC